MGERMTDERLTALKDFYQYPENEPETMWAFHIREVLQGMDAEREEVEHLRSVIDAEKSRRTTAECEALRLRGQLTEARQALAEFDNNIIDEVDCLDRIDSAIAQANDTEQAK